MDTTPHRRSDSHAVLRRFVLWSLAGCGLGLVLALVGLRVWHHDATPALTPEVFRAAKQRWQSAAPPNYDVTVQISGAQAAVYRVEVRAGQPIAAWRNGQPLKQRRTFGTWSVPGMFGTISRDVEAIERRAAGQAKPGEPELILRARFDPRLSYPQHYRRTEWGSRRGSTAATATWEVVEFRPVP